MSDAVSMVFNNNNDPYIRIYAYLEDACREKKSMPMSGEDCARALDTIMHDCKCAFTTAGERGH
jgi:hypothetical protein